MIATHPVGKTFFGRIVVAGLAASLLLMPASRTARAARLRTFVALPQSSQSQTEADEARREREEEERERQREREEQKREREEEAREREQERLERQQELYEDGREDLDDDHYEQALSKFTELARLNGPQTDAALYWKAYAENKLGKKAAALATIAEVKSKYAQSRWKKDAEALELEVRQDSRQNPPNPDTESDKDLKALALQSLLNSDPGRAMPIIEKILSGPESPKYKAKVLFLAAQTGSPQGMELLAKTARGQGNPELQRKAVEYLGMFGGEKSHKILADLYTATADESVRRAILRSYMLSGDRASLFAAAKSEKNESLRHEAIRQLGLTGGKDELQQLYQTESSTDLRREILQALFLSGDSAKLEQVAANEKDIELRRTAIRNLGLMGAPADKLQPIYNRETDRSLKEEVLNAYFLSGNAKALVAVARAEKDPGLKKKAVEKLTLMGSKEGNDYLMELLEK